MTSTLSPPSTPPALLADLPATASLGFRMAQHIGLVASLTVEPGHLVIVLEQPARAQLVADQYALDLEESTQIRSTFEGYVDDVYVVLHGAPVTEAVSQ